MIQIWLKREQFLRNTYFPSRNISLSSSFRLLLLYIFNDGQCLIWREREIEEGKKRANRKKGREGGRKEGRKGRREKDERK